MHLFSMKRLVLLRHGQSEWNAAGRFTGWVDVMLTPQGREEAVQAGRLLRAAGIHVRQAFTSVLTRAIETLNLALLEMGLSWIPVQKDWRLNERHYGLLQGMGKQAAAEEYGAEQVRLWRRSYDAVPPVLQPDLARHQHGDARYHHVPPWRLPTAESLADTLVRVRSCWLETLAPVLLRRGDLFVVAHGNSLRALLMLLRGLSPQEVESLNVPTGIPLLVETDDSLQFRGQRYLADAIRVESALAAAERGQG